MISYEADSRTCTLGIANVPTKSLTFYGQREDRVTKSLLVARSTAFEGEIIISLRGTHEEFANFINVYVIQIVKESIQSLIILFEIKTYEKVP